jgi:hypothetical protein
MILKLKNNASTEKCRQCKSAIYHLFIDLGHSPLCERFLKAHQLSQMEPYYPLKVMVCEQCFLVQIPEFVSPRDIFSEYAYFSSYSTSWVARAKHYCHLIAERIQLNEKSLVVEIASNDGYLLQHFIPMGIPILGVEPAKNVAIAAEGIGVPTVVDFFGTRLAQDLANNRRQADLIVGNNVLAQVPDINDFVNGIKILLAPNGVVTLEFPHLLRLIEENQFDTIYNEPFSYFSLTTIDYLAKAHTLKIIDVDELPTHGGSLRVYFAHGDNDRPVSERVSTLLRSESDSGLHDIEAYKGFDKSVWKVKRDLVKFLIECQQSGLKVCGYGAPGKGNTLLNYCGIGPDLLPYTVDRNPYKHGRYTPGRHIPILPVEAIDERRPDVVLILPWNLKDEIVDQMRHIGDWGGKFAVPIPRIEIIEAGKSIS